MSHWILHSVNVTLNITRCQCHTVYYTLAVSHWILHCVSVTLNIALCQCQCHAEYYALSVSVSHWILHSVSVTLDITHHTHTTHLYSASSQPCPHITHYVTPLPPNPPPTHTHHTPLFTTTQPCPRITHDVTPYTTHLYSAPLSSPHIALYVPPTPLFSITPALCPYYTLCNPPPPPPTHTQTHHIPLSSTNQPCPHSTHYVTPYTTHLYSAPPQPCPHITHYVPPPPHPTHTPHTFIQHQSALSPCYTFCNPLHHTPLFSTTQPCPYYTLCNLPTSHTFIQHQSAMPPPPYYTFCNPLHHTPLLSTTQPVPHITHYVAPHTTHFYSALPSPAPI